MRKRLAVGVAVASALATFVPVLYAASTSAATNTTVVLTFDDDRGTQTTTKTLLDAHGMVGTFYINSNTVGTNAHLTWAQLQAYQAGGNEIAGHTLDHTDLTTISASQAQAQVCNDRTALISHGFTPTNFAYPYGAGWDRASVHALAQTCGYSSARRASGLNSSSPPYADSLPPADIWAIKTAEMPDETFSLARLQGFVTAAETHGGGLVTIVFHENLSNFGAFLDWLQPRAASGTVVKTMAQALGQVGTPPPPPTDTTAPTSSITCNGAACSSSGYGASVQVSLSATDNAGGSGVASIRYTTDGSTPSLLSAAYGSPFTVSSTRTVRFRAYDNQGNAEAVKSQVVTISGSADTTPPTSVIACNGAACSSSWYGGGVQVSLSATDNAGGSGVASIRYTTDGSTPSPASAAYSSPFTVSATRSVRFRAYDIQGNAEAVKSQAVLIDTAAPTSSIRCNGTTCSTRWYRNAVQVTLSASDAGSGVASIRYTTNGSNPTLSSAAYSAPFALTSTKTVKYRAYDNLGRAEAVRSTILRIETSAPALTMTALPSRAAATRNVNASARVKDGESRITSVRFYVDGKLVATDTKPAFSFKWKTARLTRNLHRVTAKAFDAAGNCSIKSIVVALH